MENFKNEQKKVKMDKSIYDSEKAKGYLMRFDLASAMLMGVFWIIGYVMEVWEEAPALELLALFPIAYILYAINDLLILKDTSIVLTETEISGRPMRTFFFWKPENVVISFSDVIDVSYKVTWGHKDINMLGAGFVIINSKKGQYKFVCCNPERVSTYVLHKKKG